MPDFRYMTVGPTPNASKTQWEAFAQDPAGDGSATPYIVPDPENPGEFLANKGVAIHQYVDDNGNRRYDVRLYSDYAAEDYDGVKDHPTKVDGEGNPLKIRGSKIRAQFKVNGVSGTQLIERKRPTYDVDGNVTGEEIWATGTPPVSQWRNILLIGDPDDGDLGDPLLEEHRWL